MKFNKKVLTAGATLLTAFSLAQVATPVHADDAGSKVTWKIAGHQLKDDWLHKFGHEYYFNKDGYRLTNKTATIDGDTYHFDKDGVMVRDGFATVNGKVYYFTKSGEEAKDYFYKNWGNTYYFGKDGARYTNQWYKNWGNTYYFGDGGVLYTNTTAKIDGKIYYFDGNGVMAKSKDITFDGISYHADKNGVLTQNKVQSVGFDPSEINWTYELGANEGDSRLALPYYIILHEVGAESGAAANANYLKNNWYNANTTFVVGDGGQVFCVSDPGYVSWGALDANPYAPVQIELGRTWNRAQFLQDYAKYIAVARYYSNYYGIPTTLDDGGVGTKGDKSHRWVSRNMSGDHQDPYGYFESWGISEDQLTHDINNGVDMNQLNSVVYAQRQ